MNDKKYSNIIFFDGKCGVCNSFVNFVLSNDLNIFFNFTTLQSEFSKKTLPSNLLKNLDTIVVKIDDQIYTKSDAILIASKHLVFPYKLLYIFFFIPSFVRNFFYSIFAKYRNKISKKIHCRLLSQEEKKRFI